MLGLDPVTIAAFMGTGILLNLTPGADVMFASASGMAGGWRAGVAAAAGVSLGGLMHTALAALGLSALLLAYPLAYDAVRYIGAAYLAYLALRAWRAGPAPEVSGAPRLGRALLRGFVTNALNPKVALFVLALLPQFTRPESGPVWAQILLLGGLFSVTGFVITGAYGVLAGLFAPRLGRAARWMNRLSALVFGGLALRLVIDG